ncbi:MAG: Rrf2 family transcriptional regulator [Eubacteriales bacterium]|nr:Rrf2 family transcriptional regulator [Eubacteriales bacterium]
MKLSTRGKYGLYAMFYLAQHDGAGPQSLQSIASTGVPRQYLEQLLGNLRRAGLVSTVRGAQGGYQLAKKPADVTILDIIDAMEGPLELSECMNEDNHCTRACQCPVRYVWQRLTDSINGELARVTLEDMLHQPCNLPCKGEEPQND